MTIRNLFFTVIAVGWCLPVNGHNPHGGQNPRGLVNLGNTCYMNAVLQCLFALPAFRQAIEASVQNDTADLTVVALHDLMQEYQEGDIWVEPLSFFECVSAQNLLGPGVNLNRQQDATELYEQLAEKLTPQAVFKELFGVSYETLLSSSNPDEFRPADIKYVDEWVVRTTHGYFNDASGIEEGILGFFKERVSEDREAEHAGANRPYTVSSRNILRDARDYLVIAAPRINPDYTKNLTPIGATLRPVPLTVQKNADTSEVLWYDLMGVVLHRGQTLNSGHYSAVTRYGDQWYECNDTDVTPLTDGEVKDMLVGRTGYQTVLFFFQRDNAALKEYRNTQNMIDQQRLAYGGPSVLHGALMRGLRPAYLPEYQESIGDLLDID